MVLTKTVSIDRNGRVTIPVEVREALGHSDLLLTYENGRIILDSRSSLLEQLYQAVGEPPEEGLVSDELIAERRAEAEREAE